MNAGAAVLESSNPDQILPVHRTVSLLHAVQLSVVLGWRTCFSWARLGNVRGMSGRSSTLSFSSRRFRIT